MQDDGWTSTETLETLEQLRRSGDRRTWFGIVDVVVALSPKIVLRRQRAVFFRCS